MPIVRKSSDNEEREKERGCVTESLKSCMRSGCNGKPKVSYPLVDFDNCETAETVGRETEAREWHPILTDARNAMGPERLP